MKDNRIDYLPVIESSNNEVNVRLKWPSNNISSRSLIAWLTKSLTSKSFRTLLLTPKAVAGLRIIASSPEYSSPISLYSLYLLIGFVSESSVHVLLRAPYTLPVLAYYVPAVVVGSSQSFHFFVIIATILQSDIGINVCATFFGK